MNEVTNLPAQKDKLHSALEKLNAQLKSVKALTDMPYKTNGEFKYTPNSPSAAAIKITDCKELGTLLSIYSFLSSKNRDYIESAKELELQEYPVFAWQGYPWEMWQNDLKIRIALVSQHVQISKIKSAKAKLEQFLTAEDQLTITLKELGFDQ